MTLDKHEPRSKASLAAHLAKAIAGSLSARLVEDLDIWTTGEAERAGEAVGGALFACVKGIEELGRRERTADERTPDQVAAAVRGPDYSLCCGCGGTGVFAGSTCALCGFVGVALRGKDLEEVVTNEAEVAEAVEFLSGKSIGTSLRPFERVAIVPGEIWITKAARERYGDAILRAVAGSPDATIHEVEDGERP